MNDHLTMRRWRIRVPATAANLGPGFDCFGLALQRYLTLAAAVLDEDGEWSLNVTGEGADVLPVDRSNLVYQSLLVGFGSESGLLPGLHVSMHSDIPLARGQGSSAAATVCGIALGHLLRAGEIEIGELVDEATVIEGHADNVAAAVLGGLVITRDGGSDHVRTLRVPTANGVTFVSAVPDFEVSTSAARKILPREVPFSDAVFNLRAASWVAAAWAAGDWEGVGEAMDDRLHQQYRCALIPGYDAVSAAARSAGALAVCLSGSGPTLLALVPNTADTDAVAGAMVDAWRMHDVTSRADAMPVDTQGIVAEAVTSTNAEERFTTI